MSSSKHNRSYLNDFGIDMFGNCVLADLSTFLVSSLPVPSTASAALSLVIMSSATGLSMTSSISLVRSAAATDSHSIGSDEAEGGLPGIAGNGFNRYFGIWAHLRAIL